MEAKVSPETVMRKAQLLAGGAVKLPRDFRLPFAPSRSTAGPGAGRQEVVFSFGGARAKKEISRESGEFELVEDKDGLSLLRRGEPFVRRVELVQTLLHAPFQAFINVDSRCEYRCAFCGSHRLDPHATKNLGDDKIVEMAVGASGTPGFTGVAITSGVVGSPAETVDRLVGLVTRIRAELPGTPVGVEPYVTRPDQIDRLREAGVTEIKINIESFDRDVFEKICTGRDYDVILHGINHACEVFGRNKVCSNIIFGMGESDETVIHGLKVLGNMGAVGTLRALRVNDLNRADLEIALGRLEPVTADRMLRLAEQQKRILQDYGLTTLSFKTMCHACLACDIVPFWDV
ncbi:TPA: radical SAM protein [Thermoplasmata archaeon]|nr:radical SAM protein [Thermoplasmata archaeon]